MGVATSQNSAFRSQKSECLRAAWPRCAEFRILVSDSLPPTPESLVLPCREGPSGRVNQSASGFRLQAPGWNSLGLPKPGARSPKPGRFFTRFSGASRRGLKTPPYTTQVNPGIWAVFRSAWLGLKSHPTAHSESRARRSSAVAAGTPSAFCLPPSDF